MSKRADRCDLLLQTGGPSGTGGGPPHSPTSSVPSRYNYWGLTGSPTDPPNLNLNLAIGRTSAKRSYQTASPTQDVGNIYTATVTPGPGAYSPEKFTGMAARITRKIGGKSQGKGTTAQRHCLLPTATHTMPYRSTISPRPGPGDYAADYNSVLPKRSTTFDGHVKQANACSDTAHAVASLAERKRILEGRYRRVADKLTTLDTSLDPESPDFKKQEALRETTEAEMDRLRQLIRSTNQTLKQAKVLMSKELSRKGNPTKAVAYGLDKSHGNCPPFSHTAPKFDKEPHPSIKEGAVPSIQNAGHMSPGPGAYHQGTMTFGRETRSRSPTFRGAPRPTDPDADVNHSHVSLRLHSNGGLPYFSSVSSLGPGEYSPVLTHTPNGSRSRSGAARSFAGF